MSKTAAIYARVSSDQQKEQHTIASQTAALREYAQKHDYIIPAEWVFEDEGFSGGVLARPALERLRDRIAEGEIQTVLLYGPDRLSRNYAYQVLLLEEFARHGAKAVFLNAPPADTPEERLLLQFQGMMAEYERAQIAERCRRGKRHRAKAGSVSVLSAAPYGYRYVKKSEGATAYYELVEEEAAVVRKIFSLFVEEGRTLRSVVRELNEQKIPTRSKKAQWVHSTVYAMLKNPAYYGRAGYGKTENVPVHRVNKTSREKGHSGIGAIRHKRIKAPWIEISVPAMISKEVFALAQERFQLNQRLSRRHTKEPSVLQSMVVCAHCGYAMCRTGRPRPGTTRRYWYYRCLGSDRRRPRGRICSARPVRVDHLDQLVWEQVWQLLSDPQMIEEEIKRRVQECQQSGPIEQRQDELSKEIARLRLQADKLIDGYQAGVMELPELRQRMPELRRRQSALEKELEGLNLKVVEQRRLTEMNVSMEKFMAELRHSAQTLDVETKQKIVRLLIRQVVVGSDIVTIHHSIPLFRDLSGQKVPSYRLCTNRYTVTTLVNIDRN